MRRYEWEERRFEETDTWDLSAQSEVIEKFAKERWQSMSISKRALVLVHRRDVSIITLNTSQLTSYTSGDTRYEQPISVSGSLSCNKMII